MKQFKWVWVSGKKREGVSRPRGDGKWRIAKRPYRSEGLGGLFYRGALAEARLGRGQAAVGLRTHVWVVVRVGIAVRVWIAVGATASVS